VVLLAVAAFAAGALPAGTGAYHIQADSRPPSTVSSGTDLRATEATARSAGPSERSSASAITHTALFKESGLVNGTLWSVVLNGLTEYGTVLNPTHVTVSFTALANGSYPYFVPPASGYGPTPSSGRAIISGANTTVNLAFKSIIPTDYTVTIVENGLKGGSVWSATLNGTTFYTNSDFLAFSVPNGTYSFGVGSVNGYTVSPQQGTVVVNGSSPGPVTISFSTITFLGLVPAEGYAVLSALVSLAVVVGVGILFFVWRRFRSRPASRPLRPAPPVQPPPPAPPAK